MRPAPGLWRGLRPPNADGAPAPARVRRGRLAGSGSPVHAAGPSPSAKPRRDSDSVGLRAPGGCVTSRRKSSISPSWRTRIWFRSRFVLSHVIAWLSKSVQHPGRRPGRPAAERGVSERARAVYHHEQPEHVRLPAARRPDNRGLRSGRCRNTRRAWTTASSSWACAGLVTVPLGTPLADSAGVGLRVSYAAGCCRPSSSGCVRTALRRGCSRQ